MGIGWKVLVGGFILLIPPTQGGHGDNEVLLFIQGEGRPEPRRTSGKVFIFNNVDQLIKLIPYMELKESDLETMRLDMGPQTYREDEVRSKLREHFNGNKKSPALLKVGDREIENPTFPAKYETPPTGRKKKDFDEE